MPKSFYLIDGHAQIFRAYYAPFGNLTAPSGEPTRATHVFSQMLLNLIRDRKPDYLAVALDVSDSTVFRCAIYPEYKAHREPPPEDFPVQARRIISILEAAKIPILRKEGFEADDVMATLAQRLGRAYFHVYLVSRDKDLDQLLTDHVSLYDPFKDLTITPQKLYELKGWRPESAIEAQTLIGDNVDNVPGVKGVGEKTAAKLLEKYGTAQGVIDHADELTPKQRENVLAFRSQIDVTRRLVTLRTDVEIDFDLDAARPEQFDWPAVRRIFAELGFRKLPDQIPTREGASAADPPPPVAAAPPRPARSLFSAAEDDEPAASSDDVLMAVNRAFQSITPIADDDVRRLRSPDGGDYRLIRTAAELDALVEQLAQQPALAIDTETTGLSAIDADIVGISIAWQPGVAYYLATQTVYGDVLPMEQVRRRLGPILADAARVKTGHNLKYDLTVLRQAGVPVAGPFFDTMIAAFVLDPMQSSYGMNSLVFKLFGHEMIPISDLIGKGRDQLRMDQVPLSRICEYAAEDADYTWRMHALFEPVLRRSDVGPLFYDTEMPLVSVLTEMEFNGVTLDVDHLARMSRTMAARAAEIVDAVHSLAGQPFNLDSPKQLAEILFDKRGMRVVRRTRTTRSTDAETLEVLFQETQDPLLKLLLEYRELQKLRGTYVDALPASRSRRTGRVHTSYHQTGAVTGRLSSSEPNLQNIPIRTEAGREIRRAFVPRSSEERLIVADYSQVELRVLAHYCEDEELIRAFAEDRDIHQFVAAQLNNVPLDAVTREMRGRAKAVNFGLIYGQTAFGLAQGTGMSRTEATAFIEAYFKRYPRIRGFIDRCIAGARRDGFVRTMLGRRRPITNLDSRNSSARAQAERLAVNTVIQGSAADLIKIAMIRLDRRIRAESLPLRMLLQVHDELVCEGPAARADDLATVVRETMSGAARLRVPLKVDIASGTNWLEAK